MKLLKVKSKWLYSRFFKKHVTKIVLTIEEDTTLSIQQETAIINFFKTL
jgi:hypothetical protein